MGYKGKHRAPAPSISDTAGRMTAVGVTAALPIIGGIAPADAATPPNWGPIIACESGGSPTIKNVVGTASGLFQFLDTTWKGLGGIEAHASQAPVSEQYAIANKQYAISGYTAWAASRGCWGSKINQVVPLPAIVPAPVPIAPEVSAVLTTPKHALSDVAAVVGAFASPVVGVITQQQHAGHDGLDIAAPLGTPEFAAANGVVINAGPADGYGLWVRIRLADGLILTYGHMNTMSVHVGQNVVAGQQIATVGARGNATGPHLHFQINTATGGVVNAMSWLLGNGISPTGGTTGKHVAPVPAPAVAAAAGGVAADGLPADTGRDHNGYGTYICDAAHLYFRACDPKDIGNRVQYPHFD